MFSELKKYLDVIHEEEPIPACDCIVYHGHEIVFRYMVGHSDVAKKNPVSAKDKYIMYSVTKPMTMVAVMQLVEKGCINLDDEISLYLPEFDIMYVGDKKAQNKITIEHLMSMRGGFNYNINAEGIQEVIRNNPNATLSEVMKGLAKQPLDFEPGTHFQYSLCHDVLGRIIEVVSGLTYGEYMKQNIFEPLGMTDTGFCTEDTAANLTEQYVLDSVSRQLAAVGRVNPFRLTPCYESAGAGLVSTVDDYGKFLDAMCNYGVSDSGVRIISEQSIDLIRNSRLNDACDEDFRKWTAMKGYSYGLGVRTMVDNAGSGSRSPIGEFGWNGAAGAYALFDVENQIGIFYAQEIRGKAMSVEIHPRIRDLVYEAIFPTVSM